MSTIPKPLAHAIKEQVRALPRTGGTQDIINRVREKVIGQVGEVAADVAAITSKLRGVDRKYDAAIDTKEKATEKRDSKMIQRVKGVEGSLKQYRGESRFSIRVALRSPSLMCHRQHEWNYSCGLETST